jgi:hypothetical protein
MAFDLTARRNSHGIAPLRRLNGRAIPDPASFTVFAHESPPRSTRFKAENGSVSQRSS